MYFINTSTYYSGVHVAVLNVLYYRFWIVINICFLVKTIKYVLYTHCTVDECEISIILLHTHGLQLMQNCMQIVSTEQDRTINITAMSCTFSGPPRAGKTTVIKRLKGEDVDISENTASTGIVDERGLIRIEFMPSSNVVTDQEWVEMEEEDEIQAFLNLTIIPQQTQSEDNLSVESIKEDDISPSCMDVPPHNSFDQPSINIEASSPTVEAPVETPSQTVDTSPAPVEVPSLTVQAAFKDPRIEAPLPLSTEAPSSVSTDTCQESETRDINMTELSPKSVLKRALCHSQQIRATRALCKRYILYLTDTGGQPDFRKMTALLIPRPSNTFIVFRMFDEFDSRYLVRFCHQTNGDEIAYSSFSIRDTINDIIEHLFCSELHSKVKGSIMFIGTHRDMIPKKKREEVIMRRNKELLLILEQCPHYHPDMVVKSDEDNIIFCVDNHTFENEHRCIRSSVVRICETERFQVQVKPELLLLALTLKGAKVTVLPFDMCVQVAMDCGILEDDVREALFLLHEKLMTIRVYELNKDDVVVVVKPRALTNKVSNLLKFMITRDEQVYSNPVVSYTKLQEIATDGEYMETDTLIKILVHLLIIAPISKSRHETEEGFLVPSMFRDSTYYKSTASTVPSIKAVRVRAERNQLLIAFKAFKFSVPSTLHSPVLCSLLQDKQWNIQNTGSDLSKSCIILSKGMKHTVTFTVTFFQECVALCLGDKWNEGNVSSEILQQCIHAEQALMSALRTSLRLVGYGDIKVFKYCYRCFEQSLSSTNIQGDCTMSHIITPVYPYNIWFLKVSLN